LYYFSYNSFDNDVATFFKEGIIGKRIIFFVASILSIALLIFIAIIVVAEHLNY
jgi:hypothetical protein